MNWRPFALPGGAIVLVAAVLGVQLSAGGTDYRPSTPPSACSAAPPAIPEQPDLEALSEVVVVDGVRRAACELGTSRERLLVALPSASDRAALARSLGVSDAELLERLRRGLRQAVARIESADALPPVSSLVGDLVEQLGLPGLAQEAIKRLPKDVVDEYLPTGPILERAIAEVDLAKVLDGLGSDGRLEDALVPVVRDAAIDEARARLKERLGSLGDLLGAVTP